MESKGKTCSKPMFSATNDKPRNSIEDTGIKRFIPREWVKTTAINAMPDESLKSFPDGWINSSQPYLTHMNR
jgi:hypothetical protein